MDKYSDRQVATYYTKQVNTDLHNVPLWLATYKELVVKLHLKHNQFKALDPRYSNLE